MGVFANSNVCQIDLQVNADYDIGKVKMKGQLYFSVELRLLLAALYTGDGM